ncbi:MAG TPA: PAS domain-containing protein, partial [Paracoccus sp.]|nr:PAS domain-containing protein [Paracoccus sp. (in: a-proteobacteria)]
MVTSAGLWGGPAAAILLAASTTLGLIAAAAGVAVGLDQRRRKSLVDALALAAVYDPDAILLTDADGRCLAANPAAAAQGAAPSAAALLQRWSAEPARVAATILDEVHAQGRARRDFTRPGNGLQLAVHQANADDGGSGLLVWRFSFGAEGAARSMDMLGLPVLTLGPGNAVVAANASLRAHLGETLPEAAPALPAELVAGLQQGGIAVPVVLPGPGGGQRRLALSSTGRDGQRDIVFLPDWMAPEGAPPQPSHRHDFEDIPVALMHIGADGRILDTNYPARSLLGLAPGETRHFWEVVEGLGRPVADWLEDAREGRALNRPEVLRATFPPQETYVQITLRRIACPASDSALVAVLSDVTELKSLEARFVQSQKMQAIGQLAGGVAHDFNNLLTAISGHCDLLLLNRDQYDPDYNDLVQIHQNANRAAALVRQLLAFSRKQTLKPETLSLESLLEELAHLLSRLVGERITLTLAHDPQAGRIRADRRQLEQVVMNLVVNARDAMPMGGEIVIESEAVTLHEELECGRARLPAGRYAVI